MSDDSLPSARDGSFENKRIFYAPEDDSVYDEIYDAVKSGHLARLDSFIKQGLNINAIDANYFNGKGAIHMAAYNGNMEVLQYLLANGANLNLRNQEDGTALNETLIRGHTKMSKFLLNAGIKVDVRSCFLSVVQGTHYYYIDRSVPYGRLTRKDVKMIKLLLDKEFDVDTPLDESGTLLINTAALGKSIELVTYLLDRKARVPNNILTMTSDYDIVNLLLLKGARITPEVSRYESTGILKAARDGNIRTLQLLLSQATNIDINKSESALIEAVAGRHLDTIDFLIDHGFDVNICVGEEPYYMTPLFQACFCWELEHLDSFLAAIDKLLAKGADVLLQAPNGITALHVAARHGCAAGICRALFDAGADAQMKCREGNTPLMQVVRHFMHDLCSTDLNERLELLEVLLQHTTDIDAQNNLGETALHAVFNNRHADPPNHQIIPAQLEAARMLIEKGANVNVRNNDGRTAVDLVAEFNTAHLLQDRLSSDSRHH